MSELDLLRLDRDVARAARGEQRFLRALRADPEGAADDAWYEPMRHATARSTFVELAELPESDPLREPLMKWVARLAVTRIGANKLIAAARARDARTLELDAPERGSFSARDLVRRAVSDREPARAKAWLDALAGGGPRVLAAEREAREASLEISSRLGIADPDWLAACERGEALAEASTFLARTGDLAAALFAGRGDRGEGLAPALAALVARDVPGVWPARPDARWVFELFRGTPLLEGVAIDLGPTPAPLGASSFARALARFGAAYARGAASTAGAFVLSHDPAGVHPARRGALFAALAADPKFLQKKLDLSREAARRTSRALAATLLAYARLAAVRARTDFALAPAREIAEAVSEALAVPVSPGLSGALPRPSARASDLLAAFLLAEGDRVELRDRFDDDWFQNPRAHLHLRDRDAAPRPARLARGALAGSAERAALSLEQLADQS